MIEGHRPQSLMGSFYTTQEKPIVALHIRPTEPRHFFFYSFPCQEKAAYIKDRAVTEVKNGDLSMIAYRYIQCQKNKSRVTEEFYLSSVGAVSAILLLCLAQREKEIPGIFKYAFTFFPLALANAYINYGNKSTYQESLVAVESFLKRKLPSEIFDSLQQIPDNNDSYDRLLALLETKSINCESLRKKLHFLITE